MWRAREKDISKNHVTSMVWGDFRLTKSIVSDQFGLIRWQSVKREKDIAILGLKGPAAEE